MKHIKTFESFSHVNEEFDLKATASKVGGALKAGASAVGGALKGAFDYLKNLPSKIQRWKDEKVKAKALKIADAMKNKVEDTELQKKVEEFKKMYLSLKPEDKLSFDKFVSNIGNFSLESVKENSSFKYVNGKLLLEGSGDDNSKVAKALFKGSAISLGLIGLVGVVLSVVGYCTNTSMVVDGINLDTLASASAGIGILGAMVGGVGSILTAEEPKRR